MCLVIKSLVKWDAVISLMSFQLVTEILGFDKYGNN